MFQQVNTKHPDYYFRYLIASDYHRALFATLNQLTKAPTPQFEEFQAHLQKMDTSAQEHLNIVAIDRKQDRVVAFGTILICNGPFGRVGKIENIVSCKTVRGKGLGKSIIDLLKWLGWDKQCSSITLFCEQTNVKFYSKLGFNEKGIIFANYRI